MSQAGHQRQQQGQQQQYGDMYLGDTNVGFSSEAQATSTGATWHSATGHSRGEQPPPPDGSYRHWGYTTDGVAHFTKNPNTTSDMTNMLPNRMGHFDAME